MEEEAVEETHKWHSTRMGEALGRNGWRAHGGNKERRGGMVGGAICGGDEPGDKRWKTDG